MAPTVYLNPLSPPARTVLMVADILGIRINIKELDPLTRAQDTPEMSRKNPMRTIPTFVDDDGFSLGDSHAIILYMFDKYAKPEHEYLYPKDMKSRALVLQRLFADCGVFFRTLRSIMSPTYGRVMTELNKNQIKNTEDTYRIADEYLSQSEFLATDSLTLADVSAVTTIATLHELWPLDEKRFPKTKQWLDRMGEYDFYRHNNKEWCIVHCEMLKELMAENKKLKSKL